MFDFRSMHLSSFRSGRRRVRQQDGRKSATRRSHIRQLLGESLEQRRVLAAYVVNTADDVVAEDGMVSLREAIQAANTNAAVNADTVAGETGPGVIDTITFADGLSIITLGSELAITDSLSISLGAASAQAISGGDASRIFTINGGDAEEVTTVSLEGLTLSDGIAERGGAIFVSSGQTLSLDSVTLTNNVATGSGANSGGGALFNDGGVVNIIDSTISENSAAAAASVSLTGAQENPPVTTAASGDATFNYDPASNTFSIDLFVTGLEVEADDDGIPQVTGAHLHLGDAGENGDVIVNLDASNFVSEAGGIRLRLTDVAFPAENVDDLVAGGIYINVHSTDNLSGEVRGQLVFPTTMGSGGGLFNLDGTLSITDTMITGNVASRAGGGVESSGGVLELTGVTLADNIAGPSGFATPGNGGGLHISADGNATITGGTVSGNVAALEGGGLWNSVGTMTVDGTTITDNTASGDAADDGGGGVFNNGGTLTISNAVLTGNVADGTLGSGGGIFSTDGDVVINSTRIGGPILADGNTANRAGGGIEVVEGNVTLNFGTDISSNFAGINGGGLHSTGEAAVTSNFAIFGSNTAASEGGGLWNSSTGTLNINGGAITANIASGDDVDNGGGGVFNDGGIVTINDAVIGFNIADGTSGSGGGVLNDGGTLTIGGNTNISSNRANRAGGGIEVTGGSITTISGASIGDNLAGVSPAVAAPGNGGGVHVGGNGVVAIMGGSVTGNAAVEGGGLWNSGAGTLTVDGTTITGNTAVRGGGVYQQESSTSQTFTVDLQTLNAAYGSTASGTATITLDTSGVTGPNSGTASIRVQIDADGLQDLSAVTGGVHVAHIHGQFAGNASRPLAEQGSGPFFSGEGGVAVGSITPSAADDGAKNIDETAAPINAATDYLDFFEGRPDYGPVVLNLTNEQLESAPDGTGPLTFFFQELAAGRVPADAFPNGTTFIRDTTYTFDLSDPDERRQYNNLTPLETREIVLHGLTIPTGISDAIDAATNAAPGSPTAGVPLGNGMSFRRTAPVAAGEIERMSGSTTITNATISNNTATGDDAEDGGGGIHNSGSLVVTDSEISGNVADGTAGSGGGVWNAGAFTAQGTEISGNTSNRAGGGIEAVDGSITTLTGVNLDGNNTGVSPAVAAPGNGGGLHITGAGTATITGGTVSNNTAASEGGGLWNGSGTMTVSGTTVSGNTASGVDDDNGGAGLFNNGGTLLIYDAVITGNTANGPRGGGGAIMNVAKGTLTIDGSTITDNTASGAMTGDGGGAVLSTDGSVTIMGSTLLDNSATGASGSGGAILSRAGSLTITDSTIAGNTANRAGGGIELGQATATLSNVVIGGDEASDGNSVAGSGANPGNGGGIHTTFESNVTITGGSIQNNTAIEGGGLWNSGAATMTVTNTVISDNSAVRGGGVYQEVGAADLPLQLTATTISNNTATGAEATDGGGGIYVNGSTVVVDGGSITGNVASGGSGSGGGVFNAGTATISNTDISNNLANRAGGGIEAIAGSTTTLMGAQLSDNVAGPEGTAAPGNGGGLHITGDGAVSLTETTVDGNTAANEGGGLWNSAAGTLDVVRSTVSNNSSGDGGGIFNDGSGGNIIVTNSTIAGNTASASGGGIASEGAMVTLTSVTIADNSATTGGGVSSTGGTVSAINSIVSRNTAGTDANVSGTLIDNGNNLIDVAAGLGTLADNGGPTRTIALLAGSPALDAGVAAGLATDQRGVARPQGTAIDIGAFESDLDGPTPTLSIAAADADKNEGNNGSTAFTFTVTRGNETTGQTTVDFNVTGTGSNPANASDFVGGVLPSGTVTFMAGQTTQTITVNVAGDAVVEPDESFVVNLSNASGGATITTAMANGIIRNDDVAQTPTLSIVATDADKNEGDTGPTAFTFTVTRGNETTGQTTVDFNVTGTGSNPANTSDFVGGVLPSGTVTFMAGQTTQTITVNVAGDAIVEPDESFVVNLSNASGGATITTAMATGVIRNDDAAQTPTLSIVATDADKNEGDSGSTAFTFNVTRGNMTTGQTTVDFNVTGTGPNPATATDFVANVLPSGTITFLDGEMTKVITIDVAVNSAFEPDESFLVTLSNPSGGATITMASATGIIRNDDVAQTPTLSIAATDADKNEGDSGSTVYTFTVTRGNATTGQTTVDFNVTGSGSSPANASDLVGGVLPSGTVTFMAGQTTQTITVNVAGDAIVEPDESFVVNLSDASGGASITTAMATGVIRNDDVPAGQAFSIIADNAVRDEGNAGLIPFTFRISRTGDSSEIATVDFAVTGLGNDPAAASDFGGTLPSGMVTFAVGEVTKLISINVLGDNGIEQDERFSVTLSNPSGDATISTGVANGTILDDDFVEQDNRILVPTLVARPHVIAGDSIPTAIIFQAVSDTTVTVIPIGIASVGETIRIVDGNTNPISSFTDGVTTATVMAGGLYAVIFEPQTSDRLYSIGSSAGFDALSNSPPTNIFRPTDTNASGETTAVDALVIINELNRDTNAVVSGEQVALRDTMFMDVNRDSHITALDALLVINYLNRQDQLSSVPTAEAEQVVPQPTRESSSFNVAREINDVAVTALFDGEAATPLVGEVDTDSVDQVAIFGPMIGANAADAALDDSESQDDELERDIELLASII